MTDSNDHLFDRLLDAVERVVGGAPQPPPIPPPTGNDDPPASPPFYHCLPEINQVFMRAQSAGAPEELIRIIDQLAVLARTLEKKKTLTCFTAEQLPKLNIGYREMVRNTLKHVEGLLTPPTDDISRVRHDIQFALLRQATLHFKTIYRELNAVRRAVKKGEQPAFADLIDALGRALEVVGYDESVMAVEKQKSPPPIPDSGFLPGRCRLTFQVAGKPQDDSPGRLLQISTQVKRRRADA